MGAPPASCRWGSDDSLHPDSHPLVPDSHPLDPDSHLGPSVDDSAGPRFPSGTLRCRWTQIPIWVHLSDDSHRHSQANTEGIPHPGSGPERIPGRANSQPLVPDSHPAGPRFPSGSIRLTIPIVIHRRIRKGFRVLHRGDSHQAEPELSGPPIGKRTRLRSSRAGSRSYLCRRGRESDGVAAQGIEAIIILGVLDGHGRAGALAVEGGRGKQHRRHGLLEV